MADRTVETDMEDGQVGYQVFWPSFSRAPGEGGWKHWNVMDGMRDR